MGEPFVYVAIDVGEDESTLREFLSGREASFLNVLDTDERVSALYDIRSHPIKFIIGRDGRLTGIAQGFRQWDSEEVKSLIQLLISKNT